MPDAPPRKSLARDIIISVFLASGLMTFIVTIAGQFAIEGIKQGVETQGLAGFWFPIVVTLMVVVVAGALLVLLALSLIRPKWRARIWAPVASRVWGLRPVTTQRYENEKFIMESIHGHLRDQTRESFKRAEDARSGMAKRADDAINQVRESIPNVVLTLLTQMNESKESSAKQMAEMRAEIDSLKRSKKSDPPKVPVPSPAPRWRLTEVTSEKDRSARVKRFRIENLIPGSVARGVRMDNSSDTYGSFRFDDAAYWPDLSGPAKGEFIGAIQGTDESGSVYIRLSWLAEDNTSRSATFRLADSDKRTKPQTEVPF